MGRALLEGPPTKGGLPGMEDILEWGAGYVLLHEKSLMLKITGEVNVVTYLHIRDSIFWIAVKLYCVQTGENIS